MTNLPRGLQDKEVEYSRKQNGDNCLTRHKRMGFLRQFLANFGDPIIKVLLAALCINIVFLFRSHDWYESIGIAVSVLLATLVSTLSEYGNESAFEKLQQEASKIRCRVVRNSRVTTVSIDDIVVGDIVLLQAGELVPADGRLIQGALTVNQSALNGESGEMQKHISNDESKALLSPSYLFRGSTVCSGEGVLEVKSVGDNTFYGQVAVELQEETRESPLKVRLGTLAKLLSKLGFLAGGCVALSDLFHGLVMENQYNLFRIVETISTPSLFIGHLLHAAMLAITVVVVAVPEGLPMMITVVLSSNMRRMLKDNVLVRKLVGIETSGSINILFTDKTGTLTKGKPSVCAFVDGTGKQYKQQAQIRKTALWELLCLSGYYNSDATMNGKEIVGGNSTDQAMLSYIHGRYPFKTNYMVQNKMSFDSTRKWSGVELHGDFEMIEGFPKGTVTLLKGAPDRLLGLCSTYVDGNGKTHPFTHASPLFSTKQNLEQQAIRTIALVAIPDELSETPENGVLIGILGLRDELRSDVKNAIQQVKDAGIQVVMMTGDGKETATAIAQNAGLLTDKTDQLVFTSDEISDMEDETLSQKIPQIRVIARALPSDKTRLIRLAQQSGLVVGMTGDGVNDAPALKKADVGFAMGSGTEIAKQAGDIVILNNHFSSIAKAILYGRTIFKSIRKFIVFQLTMNLCAVGVSVIGPFLGVEMPVTVMQMLWINIIMDTLAGLAFAGEAPLLEYMNEPPKKRNEPVINRYMVSQIVSTGCFTIGLCVWFLVDNLPKQWFRYDQNPLYWFTAFFALFIFCGIFNSINARTTRLHLLSHLRKNRAFIIILLLIIAIQILLIYVGGSLFRTTGLQVEELFKIIALSALVIPFDIVRKIILRCHHKTGTV